MPYASGKIPMKGDHVRKIRNGRGGIVTEVQRNTTSLQGHDRVSVVWDDGGVTIAVSTADEYELIKAADRKS